MTQKVRTNQSVGRERRFRSSMTGLTSFADVQTLKSPRVERHQNVEASRERRQENCVHPTLVRWCVPLAGDALQSLAPLCIRLHRWHPLHAFCPRRERNETTARRGLLASMFSCWQARGRASECALFMHVCANGKTTMPATIVRTERM